MDQLFGNSVSLDDLDLAKVCCYKDRKDGYFGSKDYQVRFGYEYECDNDADKHEAPLGLSIKYPLLSGTTLHPPTHLVHHSHYPMYAAAKLVGDVQEQLEAVVAQLAEKCEVTVSETCIETWDTLVYSTRMKQFMPKQCQSMDALLHMKLNGILLQPVFVLNPTKGATDFLCKCRIIIACTK